MKKLIFVCVFFILGSGFAFSQNYATDKGAMIIGGTAWFTSTGYEGGSSRTTGISINPVFDYFIMQNLFVGGSLSFYISSNPSSDYTSVGIGPEIGYAFANPKSSMFPFIKAGFNYFTASNKYSGTTTSSSGSTITLGGGLVFEIVKHVGIVGLLSYNIMNNKYGDNTESSNSIELGFGIYGLIYK